MSAIPRHGRLARIYIDTSSGGTAAVGTATLTLIASKANWTYDASRDFVDVTAFEDTSKTNVAGLPNGTGSISGNHDFNDTAIFNIITASSERGIMIFPDYTNQVGTYISGKAFFSSKHGGSTTTAVQFDLDYAAGPTGLAWTHP